MHTAPKLLCVVVTQQSAALVEQAAAAAASLEDQARSLTQAVSHFRLAEPMTIDAQASEGDHASQRSD